MRKAIAWCALIFGLILLIDVGAMLVEFARVLRPFGGIPWSWDLLSNNPSWVGKAGAGALLLPAGLLLLLRGFRRRTASSRAAGPLREG